MTREKHKHKASHGTCGQKILQQHIKKLCTQQLRNRHEVSFGDFQHCSGIILE
jgi:hypothetical protein